MRIIPQSGMRTLQAATLLITLVFPVDGLAQTLVREPWTISTLVGSPSPPPPWMTQRIVPSLTFSNPITVRNLPLRSKRIVLERSGRILTFDSSPDASTAEIAIDLKACVKREFDEDLNSCRDLILDPNFAANGFLYVAWSIKPFDTPGGCRVSRLTLAETQPPTIDPQTRLDILTYPSGDHCGTSLRFGPDGMLYITTGDGSLPFPPDVHRVAQDLRDVRGSVLRVDVREASQAEPYRIPDDNPFNGIDGARGEIFAFGLRNGFRSAFNPADASLWVADVGWERCELIHRIVKGGNHGWSLQEGPFPVAPEQTVAPGLEMPEDLPVDWSTPIEAAVVMQRDEAQSITGGVFISKQSKLARADPSLAGQYLYGCYVNGRVWSVDGNASPGSATQTPTITVLADSGVRIIDFEQFALDDNQPDELDIIVVDHSGGGLYRLVPNTKTVSKSFPTRLSQTGLFADLAEMQPAPGVITWTPRSEMYRHGATTIRHAGFPASAPILVKGKTKYPVGTVIANTISRQVESAEGNFKNSKIETQILLFDGLNWAPYTYRWLPDQSDAILVPTTGDSVDLVVQDERLGRKAFTHVFGATSQCKTCHHNHNSGPLTLQREHLQWLFEGKPEPKPLAFEAGADKDLEAFAKAYLNDNCSACHRRGGGATMDLYLDERQLSKTGPDEGLQRLKLAALQGNFGLAGDRLIDPGTPERSVLMYRVLTCGPGRMPKINGGDPDLKGSLLMWDWIASMAPVETASSTSRATEAMLEWKHIAGLPADDARSEAAQILCQATDPVVRGMFEPWLPMDARTTFVGDKPDASALLAMNGDVTRGRQWFLDSTSSQCRNCHQVNGADAKVGPSLAGIGSRRKPNEILDQIINPHRTIEPSWRAWIVLTVDGDIFTGRKIAEGDQWTIRLADGRDVKIAAEEIEDARPSDQSMMPSGLLAAMTPQEAADLIAFLVSLR